MDVLLQFFYVGEKIHSEGGGVFISRLSEIGDMVGMLVSSI